MMRLRRISFLLTTAAVLFAAQGCSDRETEPPDERVVELHGSGFELAFDLETGRYDVHRHG